MTTSYNISEILRMAERIEANGYQFYSQAAAATMDQNTRTVMLDLAKKEQKHQEFFAELRKDIAADDDIHLFDPDGVVGAYLQSITDSHVFNFHKDVAQLIASIQSPQSAIRLALQFEKDTIVYFTALKQAVKPENKTKVDLLISEELQHIHELQQALQNLE